VNYLLCHYFEAIDSSYSLAISCGNFTNVVIITIAISACYSDSTFWVKVELVCSLHLLIQLYF